MVFYTIYGENRTDNSNKHAEIKAVLNFKKFCKLKGFDPLKKIDLISIRISKNGKLGESRPCYNCILSLNHFGLNFKNIYYSTSNGDIKKESFDELVNSDKIHVSSGYRQKKRVSSR